MAVTYNVKDSSVHQNGASGSPYIPLWIKMALVVCILIIIGLTVTLVVREVDRDDYDDCKTSTVVVNTTPVVNMTSPPVLSCQSRFVINTTQPSSPTVFQELTETEIKSVLTYMMPRPELNLRLYHQALPTDNLIFSISNLLPPKKDVLAFLEGTAPQPPRRAKVSIFNGNPSMLSLVEYSVGPLPQPTNYTELRLNGFRHPIPWHTRPIVIIVDFRSFLVAAGIAMQFQSVLMESFGQGAVNCSEQNICLQFLPARYPGSFTAGKRITLAQFFRAYETRYMYPLPLTVRVDLTSSNVSEHVYDQVTYGDQIFPTIQDFLVKYQTGQVTKIQIPVPTPAEILRASFGPRPSMTPDAPLQAPQQMFPSGHRFSVQGRKVSYLRWTFEISRNELFFPTIYDARFNNERIAYELGLQDAAALYSTDTPELSAFMDVAALMGLSYRSLQPGVDCPESAVYMSSSFFADSSVSTVREKIFCVFEYDTGIPVRRHYVNDVLLGRIAIGGVPGKALVVRAVTITGNYDYINDYIFHPSGIIEVKVSSTGYIQSVSSSYPGAQDYGNKVTPSAVGHVHDHYMLFKVDLDVGNETNTFQTITPTPTNLSYAYEANTFRVQKILKTTNHVSESTAAIRHDGQPKYMVMTNPTQLNHLGGQRGYRIYPVFSHRNTYPDDYPVTKALAWMKYEVAVTKQNDNEVVANSLYNQYDMDNPVFDFDAFVNNNDTIEKEDLVAWVPLGGLHIPNTDDVPNTLTTGTSYTFFLKPYGFFDEDPTTTLRDGYYGVNSPPTSFNDGVTCPAN